MTMKNFALLILAAAIAATRIAGVQHEAFQAAAHLFVGGLAACWVTPWPKQTVATNFLWRWLDWRWKSLESALFWTLCAVEVACFLAFRHR